MLKSEQRGSSQKGSGRNVAVSQSTGKKKKLVRRKKEKKDDDWVGKLLDG